MPSASGSPRRRARSYDPATVRAALAAQFAAIREVVAGLREEQLDRPTRLGAWTVRDLLAHFVIVADWLPVHAEDPLPPGSTPLDLPGWTRGVRGAAKEVDAGVRESAAAGSGSLADLDAAVGRLLASADALDPDRVVRIRFGTMRVADFLVTRLVETVVHGDDLAEALGIAGTFRHDRQALAAVTRLLADALAERAPGASVELRVPPFAVVQCVEGPRHTRGTPPNVVETSPLTWIRLATGRLGWAEALDVADLTASGERSDISSLLPVMA